MRSVWRVVNEFDKDNQIISPKKRNTPNPFPKVDGFDLDAIRRIVHDFYNANESPTLNKIHAAMKIQLNFPYGRENLHQILIKIGFQYQKRGRNEFFMNVEILSAGGRSIEGGSSKSESKSQRET